MITGTQMNIPTAHIEGGDITEGGALDDSVRHAMSKLAHLHFTTNQQATNRLLEIVKRDRKWNDDGARKQLVQFFEAWGPTDEATVEGRKRLSTIMFS